VARELFLDRGGKTESVKIGNAKLRSSLELERFFIPKTSVLQKKRGLRGSKNISRGRNCPPSSRAYAPSVDRAKVVNKTATSAIQLASAFCFIINYSRKTTAPSCASTNKNFILLLTIRITVFLVIDEEQRG